MPKSNIQTQLTQWVSKKAEKRCCDDSTGPITKKCHTSDPQSSNSNNIIPIESSTLSQNDESTEVSKTTCNSPVCDHTYNMDIGNFLRTPGRTLSDNIKEKIINMNNIPPDDFIYPFTMNIRNGKSVKRSLRKSYFEQNKWLIYSHVKSGLFCKYCVLFSNKGGRYNTITLKKFIIEPVTKFSNLTGKDGDLEVHSNNKYHITAIQIADDFFKTLNNPQKEVINLINNERLSQVIENRKILKPIIESILFLGRQNIPFRGHREKGNILDNNDSIVNTGNFRELLKYRVLSGDSTLEKHLTSKSKSTYISPRVQNDLIKCCKQIITLQILKEVKDSKFYSVLFDETTDISHVSQMSLILRYINNGVVQENFISFINCHAYTYNTQEDAGNTIYEPKLTGEILGNTVIKILKEFSLNPDYCIGVGTDGCSVMVSSIRGAVKTIQLIAKNAVHCPCANHALNLAISKSSTVQCMRNNVGLLKEIISFFNMSSKRNFVLKTVLNGKPQLKSLCETRWVERHDSIMIFKASIPQIIEALTNISEWSEQDSSSKAKLLLTAMCTCEFIISIEILSNLLSVTAPISKILQGADNDVLAAFDCIQDVISILENKRTQCEKVFQKLFEDSSLLMKDLYIEIKTPRLSKYQTNRSNHQSKSTEEYYRVSAFIPLLDNVLEDLKSRFLNKKNKTIMILIQLIPKHIIHIDDKMIDTITETIITHYKFDDEALEESQLKNEIEMWKEKWNRIKSEGNVFIF